MTYAMLSKFGDKFICKKSFLKANLLFGKVSSKSFIARLLESFPVIYPLHFNHLSKFEFGAKII